MSKSANSSTGRFLDTTCALWGVFLILFNGVVLSSDDGFIPGGALLLLISLAAGVGFLSALWLHRRSGYLVLALAVLWFLVVAWFRRDDATLLVWGLVWGGIAYIAPAVALLLYSRDDRPSRMPWRWGVLAVGLLALVAAIALFLGAGVATVSPDSASQSAPSGAFQYAVHHKVGSVEIDVTFSGNGSQADVQRYLEANAARAQALLQTAADERLWTTITFTEPLTAQEVEQLLRDAGVEAASYTQVGWTATGQRMASAIFSHPGSSDFDLERLAQEAISSDPAAPDYGAAMAGFMVVDGVMTVSEASLGKLLADERVYLVDTTAYEAQKLGGVTEATVRLPTPFWDMDWGAE